ncbi:ATP-binding protein [Haliea sp. E17]|uniref:ATP-binding protein n=1 Tax=Haliea sp. E17 TaxID=3401576 RepID=UPI003AAF51B5
MVRSLRRNLVLTLLSLTLLCWVVAVIITVVLAQQVVVRQVERQLVQYMDMAQHTQGLIFRNDQLQEHFWNDDMLLSREAGITRVRGFGTEGSGQALNLWFGRDQVLVGEFAPAFPEPLAEGFVTWQQRTGSNRTFWRVLYRRDVQLGVWTAVGVDLRHASSLGRAALLQAMLPLVVVLPLTVLLLLWGVRRGLRPLDRLAATIEARKPHSLAPLAADDVPLEIRPLVESLNGLLGRLQRALASESRFTANAAHELQTPLAAIKAEVQRYQRQVADTDSREMLERIATRVSRAADTVAQLLTLARLDPEQEFQREAVRLDTLVIDAVAEEGATAVQRRLEVKIPPASGAAVAGQPDWLRILVRNLVSNAFRYAREGSVVEFRLARGADTCCLVITNECEPLDDESLRRLADRFYTPPGNTAGGVGLGLSIATRIAELHAARLQLTRWQEGRGLRVEVCFPCDAVP